MAKKKTTKRRGRKPGAWTQVNPAQITAYRKEHKVSRAKLAATLGVARRQFRTGRRVSPLRQRRLRPVSWRP